MFTSFANDTLRTLALSCVLPLPSFVNSRTDIDTIAKGFALLDVVVPKQVNDV